jgi:hypothetical protein
VGLKIFGFEFKKLKNEKKSLKILHDFLSLMVSIFLQTSSIYYKFQPKQVKPKAKKLAAQHGPLRPNHWGGQNVPIRSSPLRDPHLPQPPRRVRPCPPPLGRRPATGKP